MKASTGRRVDKREKKEKRDRPSIETSVPKKPLVSHSKQKNMKKVPARVDTGLEDISRNPLTVSN